MYRLKSPGNIWIRSRALRVKRKMRIGILGLALCVVLAVSSVIFLENVRAAESSTTTVFTDPLTVHTTALGQTFVVDINVSDVADLYAWQTGITFNPEVLECTGFYEGEFLDSSNETTLFMSHYKNINNTLGIVYYRGAVILGPVPGVDGSGRLAYATFRSIAIGLSDFHLTDVMLVNSKVEQIMFEVRESFTVAFSGANYGVAIVDNLTGESSPGDPPLSGLFSTAFNVSEKEVSFAAMSVKSWFCEVSVPKALLSSKVPSEWTIKVDGTSVPYTATENTTHTSLYFEHAQGSHAVEVIGTDVAGALIPGLGLPPAAVILVALLGFVCLALALLDLRKTRKALDHKMRNPLRDPSL